MDELVLHPNALARIGHRLIKIGRQEAFLNDNARLAPGWFARLEPSSHETKIHPCVPFAETAPQTLETEAADDFRADTFFRSMKVLLAPL